MLIVYPNDLYVLFHCWVCLSAFHGGGCWSTKMPSSEEGILLGLTIFGCWSILWTGSFLLLSFPCGRYLPDPLTSGYPWILEHFSLYVPASFIADSMLVLSSPPFALDSTGHRFDVREWNNTSISNLFLSHISSLRSKVSVTNERSMNGFVSKTTDGSGQ